VVNTQDKTQPEETVAASEKQTPIAEKEKRRRTRSFSRI
jgi:hypothetical protein